tara:strand:+ start:2520 stop:2714 length:195 start_codon:yes stop_codon:yes gene_type:complete
MPIHHMPMKSLTYSTSAVDSKYIYTSNVGIPRSISSRRAIKNRCLITSCLEKCENKNPVQNANN